MVDSEELGLKVNGSITSEDIEQKKVVSEGKMTDLSDVKANHTYIMFFTLSFFFGSTF